MQSYNPKSPTVPPDLPHPLPLRQERKRWPLSPTNCENLRMAQALVLLAPYLLSVDSTQGLSAPLPGGGVFSIDALQAQRIRSAVATARMTIDCATEPEELAYLGAANEVAHKLNHLKQQATAKVPSLQHGGAA
jgi:hypothetical protein